MLHSKRWWSKCPFLHIPGDLLVTLKVHAGRISPLIALLRERPLSAKGARVVTSRYNLRLPKPAKGATLSRNRLGIGRISVKDAYFWNAPC